MALEEVSAVTWIAPNPFGEPTAYLLVHPVGLAGVDGLLEAVQGFGLRRLDTGAEMMWVGPDTLVAALRGDRAGLWRGPDLWWSQPVTDEWTGTAIARRYIVLVVGDEPLVDDDAAGLSTYLGRTEHVHAGLIKIRLKVTDQ